MNRIIKPSTDGQEVQMKERKEVMMVKDGKAIFALKFQSDDSKKRNVCIYA